MLLNESITLLNPRTWDDRNDSYFLALYKKKKKLASVAGGAPLTTGSCGYVAELGMPESYPVR